MRKRIACALLTMIMLIGLIPAAVMPASAASYRSSSEDVISLIKQFEGFNEKAFWDVNQWTIGYGTAGSEGQTMTKEEADEAMRAELTTIDDKINQFAARFNLNFNQAQHDALASFSFNCGTGWMNQSGRFRQAVVNGASGNEFLYAISLWANAASTPEAGLLKRRMCEANLYLNGEYSKNMPDQYTYVILDPNGGTPGSGGEDKMQGYLKTSDAPILAADPSKSGVIFGGWYTAKTGGEKITSLGTAVAGKTLYARYGIEVTVTDSYANVRSGAGTSYNAVDKVNQGDTLLIIETATVSGAKWGRFENGWVALQYTDYDSKVDAEKDLWNDSSESNGSNTVIATGTVKCDTYVNIRKGAGTGYAVVGKAVNGTKVEIFEFKTNGSQKWGRISSGWICMDYVNETSSGTATDSNTNSSENTTDSSNSAGSDLWGSNKGDETAAEKKSGTVTGTGVNVRKAAGTANAIVTMLNKGAKVTVYEQVTKDNMSWGRIDQGWICMNYVQLDTESTSSDSNQTTSTDPISTGKVSSTTNLNVRDGAGTSYNRVSFLTPGTAVKIYEVKEVSGVKWGRIADNRWVCMQYVKLDSDKDSDDSDSLWSGSGSSTTESTGSTDTVLATGKVNCSTELNVRSGAGTNYTKVKTLAPGAAVKIYEEKTVNGTKWGRIDEKNWVSMNYIALDSDKDETTKDDTTVNGTVNSKTVLNVRSAAGTGNSIVGYLAPGTRVSVTEQKTVSGTEWGRVSNGWVCMTYITMDASENLWN